MFEIIRKMYELQKTEKRKELNISWVIIEIDAHLLEECACLVRSIWINQLNPEILSPNV